MNAINFEIISSRIIIEKFRLLPLIFSIGILTFLSGCDSSSSDNTNESGYYQVINASKNSPELRIILTNDEDEEVIDLVSYGDASGLRNLLSGDYTMEISWQESEDEYQVILEKDIQITDDKIDMILINNEFEQVAVTEFELNFESEEFTDDEDEDQFSIQVINADTNNDSLDLYISAENETFNEAQLITNAVYQSLSDAQLYDVEEYKLYVTNTGSSEVIYESSIIDFFNNYQYFILVRENTGPSESLVTLDLIARSSLTNYPDIDSKTELRLYNGIVNHLLLPQFNGNVTVSIDSADQSYLVENLAQYSSSDDFTLDASDYAMDIFPQGETVPIAENYFVSLDPNDDKTVFLYLTEEVEEDSDGVEETSVFINNLTVSNSNRTSLYDHQINVINLIQDEEFEFIDVYFVRNDETISSADYRLSVFRASPKIITLPNNTYDVSLVANINNTDVLLEFQTMTLDAEDSDLYLVLEKDETTSSGYRLSWIEQ